MTSRLGGSGTHDHSSRTSREAFEACGNRHFSFLLGAFVLATTASLLALLLARSPGDVPLSKLRVEKVTIKAAPSPLNDVVAVAALFVNASDYVLFPHRTASDITLALDAPGLAPFNVGSWLSDIWLDPKGTWFPRNKTRGLTADKAPFVIDIANVTISLKMLDTLWPVVIYAATDLLVLGLGRDHLDYAPLRSPLVALLRSPTGHRSPLFHAQRKWSDCRNHVREWSEDARHTLLGIPLVHLEYIAAARAEKAAAGVQDQSSRNNNSAPSRLSIGSRVPTFEQLLEDDRGRHLTLPQLLADLSISNDAFAQVTQMKNCFSIPDRRPGRIHDRDTGFGTEKGCGLCAAGDLMDALAADEGRCLGDRARQYQPRHRSQRGYADRHYIGALWYALCDSEAFLLSVATLAEQVRDRVKATVEERGGISQRESLASFFFADGIVRRTTTLDHALQALHGLFPTLRQQQRMLAALATSMRHACALQDELRNRFRSLYRNSKSKTPVDPAIIGRALAHPGSSRYAPYRRTDNDV